MSHSSLRLALLASAVALSGCTVYVNNKPPPNRQQTAHTRQPTPTKVTQPAKTTTTPKPAAETPRIKGMMPFGNGTAGAFRGLAYVIPPNSQKLPDLSKLVPFAQLYTDSFIVQPQEFSGGFPGALMQEEWFAIQYEGAFEVPHDATYLFQLASDDGAILYIDGVKVIDNDGLHVTKNITANKVLKAGRHQLRLEYFQGNKGPVTLTLGMGEADQPPRPLIGVR